MHSALRINSSALAPQQISMASGCALQGGGDVVSGKVLVLHYEGPSLDYQQHNQNKEASKQANNKNLRTGDRRNESVGKGWCCQQFTVEGENQVSIHRCALASDSNHHITIGLSQDSAPVIPALERWRQED